MASNTENLNLLMKNPSTDGADTFNVQTMLNENWQKIDNNAGTVAQTLANILKPTTPPLIGLPPSTTPDDMFQALGNTGELHVWRKTVVSASEKPAGYTLGAETAKTLGLTRNSDSSSWAITVELASSVSVDDAGNVTLVSPSKLSVYAYNAFADSFSGKFFRLYSIGSSVTGTELANNEVYFVPTGNKLNIRADASSSKFYLDLGMKLVTGYAKVPAGTTTTYPVSTNPNAYQEGSNAKPAGYTLGEVVSGKYYLGNANVGYVMSYKTATSLSVSDNGILSMPTDATSFNVTYSKNGLTTDQIKSYFAGKFVQLVAVGSDSVFSPSSLFKTAPSEILFIPSNSVVTKDEFKNFDIDRYQPVTGYVAIPAGTTIEYLGKLGDKARVQVVSYVGTGTYGADNPCSLTFDFAPMFILIAGSDSFAMCIGNSAVTCYRMIYSNFPQNITTRSNRGRTISFYQATSDYGERAQCNSSGVTYNVIAIG